MAKKKYRGKGEAEPSNVVELRSALREPEEWSKYTKEFPEDLDGLAKEKGAVVRWRAIRSGEVLLRLLLLYGFALLGLRTVACWAAKMGLCRVTGEALGYRFSRSVDFLGAVLAHVIHKRLPRKKEELKLLGGLRAVMNDGTVLTVPGSRGTDLRVHAALELPAARLREVKLSGPQLGESLEVLQTKPGDLLTGDMGLGRAKGLHAVHERGAFSLTRVHPQNLRLETQAGVAIHAKEILDRADRGDFKTYVFVPLQGKKSPCFRLLVRPLSDEAASRARQKMRASARKKGRRPDALALRIAGYIWLLTTAPEAQLSDEQAFSVYRLRWQIELAFKRYKSLLSLDELRKANTPLLHVQVLAKLIVIVLAERFAASELPHLTLEQVEELRRPGPHRPPLSPWPLMKLASLALLSILAGPTSRWMRHDSDATDRLRESRRRRSTHHTLYVLLTEAQYDPQLAEIKAS